MGSYSAYFLQTGNADEAVRLLGTTSAVEGSAWLVAAFRPGDSPPRDNVLWGEVSLTKEMSATLGEIIFLYADSSTNGFGYEHSRDGVLLRKLVWFPMMDDDWTEGWLCAEGTPEPWESALFRPGRLEGVIEEARGSFEERGDGASFPEREAAIRKSWDEQRIVAMTTYPSCDATVALLVERHFGLVRPAVA